MENLLNSSVSQEHDRICPITLDVYRDPVLAGDGHVYERNAIIRWIQQQGTSPITREPLDVNDLRSDENIKQLYRPYRSNSVTYSCRTSTVSISSVTISSSEAQTERQIGCKEYCNVKRTFLIIVATSFIISPFIVATSVILFLVQSNSNAATSTSTNYPNYYQYPATIYKLPNDCTLPKITPLWYWNNVEPFNYTYYAKLYRAISNQTIISFAFRHDSTYWCLDNVSVRDLSSNNQLMTNGNFENNSSNAFFLCNSYGTSSTTFFMTSSNPYKGKGSYCDGSVGLPDYLSQKLDTIVGRVYLVSFFLQNFGDAPNGAQVVMSY